MTNARSAQAEVVRGAGGTTLRLEGEVTVHAAAAIWQRIDELPAAAFPSSGQMSTPQSSVPQTSMFDVDFAGVPRADSTAAALLVELRRRAGGAERARVRNANDQVAAVLRLADEVAAAPPPQPEPPRPSGTLVHRAGDWALRNLRTIRETFGYIGALSASLAWAVRNPRSVRWRDTLGYMTRTGADALGIVALIGFLIGWILAFQSAAQLGRFGFESYTAEAVGLTIVLELGPLMTAILVAGRSGSAFAAEIGTMKVNEEVDALVTMGLDRTRFLVTPKVIALAAMMPLLCVFADLAGIAGGLFIGTTSLDMPPDVYLRRTLDNITLWHATQGLIKGEAYALVIASIGCLRGLQTKQGAQGVGLSATSAVVTCIFYVIVVDAVLTVIFHYVS